MKGFSQKKCVDFEEIFSLIVKMSSIKVVLGLDTHLNLEVEQLAIKIAFLHGDLEEMQFSHHHEEISSSKSP